MVRPCGVAAKSAVAVKSAEEETCVAVANRPLAKLSAPPAQEPLVVALLGPVPLGPVQWGPACFGPAHSELALLGRLPQAGAPFWLEPRGPERSLSARSPSARRWRAPVRQAAAPLDSA